MIVVDDGSTDGTAEMIRDEFPAVHVVKGQGDLWWTGATNAGIKYVIENRTVGASDFILTLNNDLEVENNYLEILFHHSRIYRRALIGSVSVDINNTDRMNFCGVAWNAFTGNYRLKAKDYGCSYRKLTQTQNAVNSDLLSGRGTLIPKTVFDEIGFFDDVNFPQYAADEDFSLRAKRQGWKLVVPANVYVKSHVAETGIDAKNLRISLRNFKLILFSIKSPVNLKIRYRWAMKNTRLKVFYFLIDSAKIVLSVSFKMARQRMRG